MGSQEDGALAWAVLCFTVIHFVVKTVLPALVKGKGGDCPDAFTEDDRLILNTLKTVYDERSAQMLLMQSKTLEKLSRLNHRDND